MAGFFNSVARFGRPANRGGNGSSKTTPSPSGLGPSSSAPRLSPLPSSPSLASSLSGDDNYNTTQSYPKPLWTQEKWLKQFVKGNFMTIVAKPAIIETGEWYAHQIHESYRALIYFVNVIISNDSEELSVCSPQSCPAMSAGPHTYTWLDTNRVQTKPPACEYISNVIKWMRTKIEDRKLFPTDPHVVSAKAATFASGGLNTPSANTPIPAGPTTLNTSLAQLSGHTWVGKESGFPENFLDQCKQLCKQMFRVYAHLYWNHFVHPFYHVNLEAHMNSAFTTFICFTKESKLLTANDVMPMQGLIDVLIHQGVMTAFPTS